jgi:hypothetical protein
MFIELDNHRTLEVLSAQVHDYADLSKWYAERGDARCAALAVWAADIRVVQCLVFEGDRADPEHPVELRAVGDAVGLALVESGSATESSVRAVVEAARRSLLSAFEESARAGIVTRFVGLDHLDGLPAPAPGAANDAVNHRLDGRGGEQLVGDLLTAAADCRAVARMMALVGDDEEAERQSATADLAAYEAYLVLTSAAAGDATLAVTELRWKLAAQKAAEPPAAGEGVSGHATGMRGAILSTALPGEMTALQSLLALGRPQRSDA